MKFYLVLTVSTGITLILTWILWLRSKNIAFPLGIALIYYWTLYGAWSIVWLGGYGGEHYHYIYEQLFPIYLNDNYLFALIYLALFILVIQATLLCFVKRPNVRLKSRPPPIQIAHAAILSIAAVAGVLSYLIVSSQLAMAVASNESGYLVINEPGAHGPYHTIHQELLVIALLSLSIGLAIFASGRNARHIVGKRSALSLLSYVVLLSGMFGFCLVLGNRNPLLFSLFSGALFYLANAPKPRKCLLGVLVTVALSGITLTGFVRGLAVQSIGENVGVRQAFDSLMEIPSSTETIAAHLSLYGCIQFDVPHTYGSSFISLIASVVPRVFWPKRPLDIYWYYVDSVRGSQDQGYAIHHAAAWFLNFGVLGVILGAMVFGYIWALLHNRYYNVNKHRAHWSRIFTLLAFWTFTAGIPPLLRGGPEGYKQIIVDSFLIPTFVLFIASLGLTSKRPGTNERRRLRDRLNYHHPRERKETHSHAPLSFASNE